MLNNKILSFFISSFLFVAGIGIYTLGFAKEDGAPSGNTGSPGDDQTCAHTDCHTGSASAREGLISTDIPATGYLSGETYTVTVTIDEPGVTKFGFQASPQNIAGDLLGSMDLINTTETKFTGGGKYITHKLSGTTGTDTKTWTFNWTPEDATGDVTFYTAVNATNNDDHASGDKIYTSFVTVTEDTTNIPLTMQELNKVKFAINNPVSDVIILQISTAVNAPVTIGISDVNGNMLRVIEENTSNGTFTIPAGALASGMYFITVENDKDRLTKKFIKLN